MIRHLGVPLAAIGILTVSVALLGVLSTGASADWVVLENGRTLEGTILEETDSEIRMQLPGGTVTLPKRRIQSVHRGDKPAEGEEGERERVEHQGGAKPPAALRYLDGGANPITGEIRVPRFNVLMPMGELAHGTLVEVKDFRVINGVKMARVVMGDVDGWLPEEHLRKAPREPVIGR